MHIPLPIDRAHLEGTPYADASAAVRGTLTALEADLVLGLARTPLSDWRGTPSQLAERLIKAWPLEEIRAGFQLMEREGVLRRDGQELVLSDRERSRWVAGLRTMQTEDEAALMDHRHRGELRPIFTRAVALSTEPGLTRLVADAEGPWEEELELALAMAGEAWALGAPADDALVMRLVPRAAAWCLGRHPEIGAGVCARALAEGVLVEDLVGLLQSRMAEAEEDEHLMVSGFPLAAWALGEDVDVLLKLMEQLGTRASVVVAPLASRLDPELAHLLALRCRAAGDPGWPSVLSAGPTEESALLVAQTLRDALDSPDDADRVALAREAAEMVRDWDRLPPEVLAELARLAARPGDVPMRLAVAETLARRGLPEDIRAPIVRAAHGQAFHGHPLLRAGGSGVALALGTDDVAIVSALRPLVAQGVPGQAFGAVLDRALRRRPELGETLTRFWANGSPEALRQASLELLQPLCMRLHQELDQGAFYGLPPLSPRLRERYQVHLLQELDETSAVLAGWMGRGDAGLAQLLLAHSGPAWDLALGACGVANDAVVGRLGTNALSPDPDTSTAACNALAVLFTDSLTAEAVVPWLDSLPRHAAGQHLMERLARLPMGPA